RSLESRPRRSIYTLYPELFRCTGGHPRNRGEPAGACLPPRRPHVRNRQTCRRPKGSVVALPCLPPRPDGTEGSATRGKAASEDECELHFSVAPATEDRLRTDQTGTWEKDVSSAP